MDDKKLIVALSKEDLDELMAKAALVGATAATDILEKNYKTQEREKKDRRLHNTKLLLKNYRMLKASCANAVYEAVNASPDKITSEMIEDIMSMRDDKVIVDSIRKSAVRTATMLVHIDKMIDIYKLYCYKSGPREIRRFKIIKKLYISGKEIPIKELAKEFNVSRVTVYEDIKISEEQISALFFGVDGLKFFK